MNFQGTSIAEEERLARILQGLKLTFDQKEDTDIDGLRNSYSFIIKIYNQLYATCEKLKKQGVGVSETQTKAKNIVADAETRIKNLGIK
jgi:hypothetical protein